MQLLRALVVDDEYAARETLCRLVDWSAFGFAPPCTANDGKQALALLKEEPFDLLFTDIEMPVMNGISLIEAIREERLNQRIIIISCHEKFEYARRALQLGVEDYLIKDLLTEKELTALLSSFALRGIQEPTEAPPEEAALDEWLRMAACGTDVSVGATAIFLSMMVLAVSVDDYDAERVRQGEEALLEAISAFLSDTGSLARYYPGGDTCTLVFEVEPNPSMLFYYSHVLGFADKVRLAAKKQGIRSVSIGASNLCASAEELRKACGQAQEAVQMRMLTGPGRTTLFDTITLRKSALDFRQTEYLLKCIEDFSHYANTACLRLIDKLYQVELPSSFADIHYYRYINARLWALISAISRVQGREYETVLASIGYSDEEVRLMEDSREMSGFFKAYLLNLFAEDEKPENDNLVKRALRLIEREYTQDISLSHVAEKLHTNKSYLSRLFKEQTGDSVMNFIMKKKMARARHLLLHTQMKLYEISDSLGIASPQYFSTVFKRYAGLSPNEYKKALPEQGEE